MAEQLFQVGIKALIKNRSGQVLVLSIGNPDHWDLPGGRMDPGETMLQTLARELDEELGVAYVGTPKLLTTVLSGVTIPVGDSRVPLLLVIYDVQIDDEQFNPGEPDTIIEWADPLEAAKRLSRKFPAALTDLLK